MKRLNLLVAFLVTVAVLTSSSLSFALGVSGGDVPIPAKYINGTLQSTWDGSYSDLLAADALAMCWTTQQDRGTGPWQSEPDGFINSLLNRMGMASCYTTCNDPAVTESEDVEICAYLQSRQDGFCNMDPGTGQNKGLDTTAMRDPSTTADYVLPSPTALGLTGNFPDWLRGVAQQEVAYADLSLCMAEQLRQKLDTVQVAFASNDDLVRVQEVVRERALTAVYEYSVLGKVFASNAVPPTGSNDDLQFSLIPLSQWYRTWFSSTMATHFGDDYAEAIKLLVEATDNSIALKMRAPEAQGSFGTPSWDPATGAANGLTGPREDVLEKILYDGYDFTPNTAKRRAVSTDASDPRVSTLLGLARSAKALKLHVSGNPQFISATNASTLMLAVENYVRSTDCTNRGVPAASCILATAATPATGYFLWQRYGIGISHAQTLVDSLTEALFGPPTPASRTSGQWSYGPLFAAAATGPANPAEQLSMHVFGAHQFTGDLTQAYPAGDVIVDPKFTVRSPGAIDIQSMRTGSYLPVRDVDPSGVAQMQIGAFRYNPLNSTDGFGYPTDRRQLGSNTVLALARETLLQLSGINSVGRGIYTEAAPAVRLIEKMIGPRQVLLRQVLTPLLTPDRCPTCFLLVAKITFAGTVSTNYVNVDIISKNNDPLNLIAIVPGIPLAATLAQDASTTTIFGNTQANAIANLTYATPTAKTFSGNYKMMSTGGTWSSGSPRGVSIILKSSATPTVYEHAFTGSPVDRRNTVGPEGPFGIAVTFGGRFEREVNDAWEFDGSHWAVPKYDGFGLTHDWVPGTDASLLDDPAGTSVESHFLSRAATAADDSSAALQQAFDTLQQESLDDAAVLSSDARAQQLTNLEYSSLCGGGSTNCAPSYTYTLPSVPACAPTGADCEGFRTQLGAMVGSPTSGTPPPGVPLVAAVAAVIQSGDPAPTFAAYKGGTLQGMLLSEWSNWGGLLAAMKSAVGTVQSAIAQVAAANADVTAANADYTSITADINTAYAQIAATNATIAAQRTEYTNNKAIYDAQQTAAQNTANLECSPVAFTNARDAGYSWSGDEDLGVTASADQNGWKYHTSYKGKSWSDAALINQVSRCQSANNALTLAQQQTSLQKDSMNGLINSLNVQVLLTGAQGSALPARQTAAWAHKESAGTRYAAAQQALYAQEDSAAQAVQSAFSQVLSAVVSIDQAYAHADVDAARIAVDQTQANYDIRARFGVRARFHSYDLWRARALTENARRLALAARRALEARYVVDLSSMNATEPFVDAPAIWADQIYSSDLKPFSIGLTRNTMGGSGLYANAVKDYVNNLKLFLDGFAVQRPSAAVQSDAEVIQLSAPASQVATSSYGTPVDYIDPASSGWSFYCPATDTWIADPDVGKFLSGTPTWTLSKACAGTAPTLARLNFTLDPWGRAEGSTANPPYAARYNVRARALAINLVGSGIRSCQRTPDPSACYAEPFIRYDLKHVGPAWVTNYDESWRSLDIPKAMIESGKALATEEWLDPVSNGFNRPDVANVTRTEFADRPIGGAYELTLRLTPDVNIERIERIQVLTQTEYWVRQQ